MRGTVRFYVAKRGFGFVAPDDGGDNIYFKAESLPLRRAYDPVDGDTIEFEVQDTDKGPIACRIVLLSERETVHE